MDTAHRFWFINVFLMSIFGLASWLASNEIWTFFLLAALFLLISIGTVAFITVRGIHRMIHREKESEL